jgi:hypothetical protein
MGLITADLQAILCDKHYDLLKVIMSAHASLSGIERFQCAPSDGSGVADHLQRCALLILLFNWRLNASTGSS